ncbi:MAG TPA: YetF domain-containing protein, partial [Cytophagales bacterium]
MKPEEIHLYDIGRILMGEVPGGFMWEAVLRILFLFLMLLVAIRLMGRRMASSLTRNELAALTSLAAAIGVPVLDPGRGLLPALIIAVVVIAFQRLMAQATFRSKKVERVLLDHNNILIEDGCINQQEMRKAGLSQERLFAQLRSEGIDSLGKVQRLYFEPSGKFTVLEAP